MIKNYFNIAWRNLKKNKLYSFINIGGLSVAISICMLIMLYVVHEMSFDRFHKNAERIYYLAMTSKFDNSEISIDRMSYVSGSMLKDADPGIESYLRMEEINDNRVIENIADPEKKFTEKNILLADSNFFNFFSFHLLQGNSKQVLNKPFSMVISLRAAQKYFGNANPVSKFLKYDDHYNFEITGVVANPPSNSSIDYDFIGSMSSLIGMGEVDPGRSSEKFEAGNFKTFILLRNADRIQTTSNIARQLAGMSEGKFNKFNYSLNALANRHKDYDSPSNQKYRKVFSWVAALILFLALINYMSLATALSTNRSKEVGVRKVLGAGRDKIVKQFYVESCLYAFIAFILGGLLFSILRPAFYSLLQLKIDDTFLKSTYIMYVFAGIFLVTIFISGSYPSLVLSSFNPIKVLYGRLGKQKTSAFVRKFFTVLQFTISVALIISSVIINRQLYFFRHMDTGVQREQIVMIPYQKDISQHYLAFKRSVENVKGIASVSTSAAPMYAGIDMTSAHFKDANENIFISEMYVDQGFFKMLGMRWKFPPADERLPARHDQVIINEEAINKLNLPVNPVGQQIVVGHDSVTVCAVLKNFNFASLHHKIEPLCLFVLNDTDSTWYADNGDCLFAKIRSHTNIPGLLASVKNIYDRFDKQTPFKYQFMDDAFDALYRSENRLSKIFEAFTIITIFIACLGLFGLAAFSASQRTKEIGIRKVLGADVTSIVTIISGNFIMPVLISILIAVPMAWLFMNKWLQDFAYRTHISVWIFVLAALAALLIALATVSFHAIKAAIANPVKSLRTE